MIEILDSIKNYFLVHYTEWLLIVGIFIVGFFIIKLINKSLSRLFARTEFDPTLEIFIQKVIKITLWIILILIILSNLGFNVTGFIAGLGIIGFIVGFATKDVLSNIAAGIFSLINKPFKVGESVEVAGIKGTVKEMGISACIIITDNKEYVTVPNSKIWGNSIKNFSRTQK